VTVCAMSNHVKKATISIKMHASVSWMSPSASSIATVHGLQTPIVVSANVISWSSVWQGTSLIERIPVLALKNQNSAIKNAKSLSNYQQTHVNVSVVSLTTIVKLVATYSARIYVNVSNHVRSGASKATSLTKNTANVSRSPKLVMSNVSRGSERT
jgi:hypothetical protein